MKISRRRLVILGAIALAVIFLLSLIAAPSQSQLNSGSTYGRAPDGYGAWYAYMQAQGTEIQRWEKPFQELLESESINSPITFVRVFSLLTEQGFYDFSRDWVAKGNTLVILGVEKPVTEADFSTLQASEVGEVKIETQRRDAEAKEVILGDRYGAIVWSEMVGAGSIIYATTPYLAANAYQNAAGNFAFLAELVSSESRPIWIDEYIHGYKDREQIQEEIGENVLSYLLKTPLFPVFVQGLVILLIVIFAANRRFGQPSILATPAVDNSEAYIDALAGVLQKAGSTEFVLEVLGKEEQLQLQRFLGLGDILLEERVLVSAFGEQTARARQELAQILKLQAEKRRISETELLQWLSKWEDILGIRD
ncbi:MAG: DUF4350 domain-containing protein [Oscillatoria sp. PMC 1068.18]|nr:DUF4350 domain-containing protein [Oscillatoria sp. PMC 1076.18]MEC4991191.1 DUF4350 domain-containing protein [Oscillatoria sp. PMC 1068.18]